MRSVDSGGPLLAWGSNTDRWEIPGMIRVKLVNGSGGVRYGYSALIANQWHHILISILVTVQISMLPSVLGWKFGGYARFFSEWSFQPGLTMI